MKPVYTLLALFTGLFLFTEVSAQQRCASHEVLKQQMAANPAFARKVGETEKSYANYIRQTDRQDNARAIITIPVIVHVLYNTTEQNISDAQVQSQIDVLNEDFTATNSDYNNYDAGYGAVKGDADIEFCLVQIVRQFTRHRHFNANDVMKYTRRGGSDAVTPMNAMNIWVCNLGQNLLGYAQFPGGPEETFGVVCHYRAFGRGASYNLFSAYNLGRTMTHEVGHCLGLRHIWGDATCGNDFVDDTPLHNTANFGCPDEGHLSTCTGTPLEMWMNYMDYTDDRCMYILSDGQVSRMDFFIDTDEQLQSIFNSSCTGAGRSPVTKNNGKPTRGMRMPDAGLSIYPNITSAQVNLQFKATDAGINEITVYNLAGTVMLKQSITVAAGENTRQLDVSRLVNGVYIVQLNSNSEKRMGKLIVQH